MAVVSLKCAAALTIRPIAHWAGIPDTPSISVGRATDTAVPYVAMCNVSRDVRANRRKASSSKSSDEDDHLSLFLLGFFVLFCLFVCFLLLVLL